MRIPAIEVGNGSTIPSMDHFAEYGFYEANPATGTLQPTPPFLFHPPLPAVGPARPAPATATPIRTMPRPPGGAAPTGGQHRRDPDRSTASGSPTSRRSGPVRS